MATVTLCVIARDEEQLLPRCLASVAGTVDEVVLVDTGSTDRTIEIARAAGARVVSHPWGDDFAAARNTGLAHVTTDWILVLDADEELIPGAGAALRRAVVRGDFDCGFLPLHNAASVDAPPADVVRGEAREGEAVWLPRLLRRTPGLRYAGAVHESVSAWLGDRPVRRVDAPIVHRGYTPAVLATRDKRTRNRVLLCRRLAVDPADAGARAYLARDLLDAGDRDAARLQGERALDQAERDHRRGLRTAVVSLVSLLALLALEDGDAPRALATLGRARSLGEDHPNLDLLEGLAHDLAEDLPEALRALERARGAHGGAWAEELIPGATTWAAATAAAVVHLQLRDARGAQVQVEAALAAVPGHVPAVLAHAELLLLVDRPAEAMQLLLPQLRDSRPAPDTLILATLASLGLGARKEVAQLASRARHADRHHLKARHREALLDLALREVEALAVLTGTLGQAPVPRDRAASARALREAAEHIGRGQDAEALQALVRAVTLDLSAGPAWSALGQLLLRHRQLDLARPVAAAAERLDPTSAWPLAAGLALEDADWAGAAAALRRGGAAPDAREDLAQLGVLGELAHTCLMVVPQVLDEVWSALHDAFRRSGVPAWFLRPSTLTALGEGPRALLERTGPTLVLVDATVGDADRWHADAAELGAVALVVGEVLPRDPAAVIAVVQQHLEAGVLPIVPRRDAPPPVSVLVPTYDRPDALLALLDRLALQDLHPSLFEILVIDDGSPTPVDVGPRPYEIVLLRQPNAGPAAARNLGLEHARGRWLVIYNDDALPAPDNLRRHLEAQAAAPEPVAVLGSFDFLPEHRASLWHEALQSTALLFSYSELQAGQTYDWTQFITCNLSLPVRALRQVGGFDAATFPLALFEDVEAGYRLQRKLKLGVRYDPTIRAEHDHRIGVDAFLRRARELGRYQILTHRKHPELSGVPVTWTENVGEQEAIDTLCARAELNADRGSASERLIRRCQTLPVPGDPALLRRRLDEVERAAQEASHRVHAEGAVEARSGRRRRVGERLDVELTSVVIPNLNGWPHVCDLVDSLRRHTDGPTELIVVDNGSDDPGLPWLRDQDDLVLLELGENLGAPAARNHGLAVARGRSIVLCDNDVVFTPGWRPALLAHLQAWPDVGMVGPMSDYVLPPQRVDDPPAPDAVDAYARERYERLRGQHAYLRRLILYFIALRREVVDEIGGIDLDYGRWGFEDDDLSLRVALAGWRQRLALDVFIRHLGSQTQRTANLTYDRFLLENWEVYKRKWDLDPALPYGTDVDHEAIVAAHRFDPARHRVPLPDRTPDGPVRLLRRQRS